MIKFIKEYFTHKDDRGFIKGLVNFGTWEEINKIESEAGIIRGNHYHEYTDELFIILEGKIEITLQKVKNNKLINNTETHIIKTGDVFVIENNINHTFNILEDSKWINVLSIKTNNDNPDIKRVENND